ncbi:hypothetical protein T440DRAFT_325303 [Plenodomus tracheiphilus IPT5]|uniref:Uncharacterized protein n=1 Tax=Plenodomus tracheiphilus IPT5 TaxID=1408161 RepID=A0A6A7BCT7_9PLEO|nr:hypothetical protein T440DRAFT_325303 [Plenodomus tracheiphilus IPT5]
MSIARRCKHGDPGSMATQAAWRHNRNSRALSAARRQIRRSACIVGGVQREGWGGRCDQRASSVCQHIVHMQRTVRLRACNSGHQCSAGLDMHLQPDGGRDQRLLLRGILEGPGHGRGRSVVDSLEACVPRWLQLANIGKRERERERDTEREMRRSMVATGNWQHCCRQLPEPPPGRQGLSDRVHVCRAPMCVSPSKSERRREVTDRSMHFIQTTSCTIA